MPSFFSFFSRSSKKIDKSEEIKNKSKFFLQEVKDGNVEKAEKLLKEGAQINFTDEYDHTALILAIEEKNIKMFEMLLQHPEVDVNAAGTEYTYIYKTIRPKGRENVTALMRAINSENLEIIEELLAHPEINFNAVDSRGESAIIYAVNNAVKFVELDSGERIMTLNRKNIIFIKKLLETKKIDLNIINVYNSTALDIAISDGYEDVFDLLVNSEGIQKNTFSKALVTAIYEKNKIFAEKLIDLGADIDSLNHEQKEGLNSLIKADEKISENSDEALSPCFIDNADKEIVKNNEANITNKFFSAILLDEINEVENLLAEGLDVNVVNKYGNTGLAYAYKKNKINIIDKLLQHPKIDVNVKVDGDLNLITAAIYDDDATMVGKLIRTGKIAINEPADDGSTILVTALLKGNEEIFDIILSAKDLNVNLPDNESTPLDYAIRNKNKSFAQKLILRGAKSDLLEEEDLDVLMKSIDEDIQNSAETEIPSSENSDVLQLTQDAVELIGSSSSVSDAL